MTMTQEMNKALVENLKRFNAKERDHLMRYAYLGRSANYTEDKVFLNNDFDRALRNLAGLGEDAHCVFAGMDYHLDWLFAALWMSTNHPDWEPDLGDSPRVPMAPHESVEGVDDLYTDLRPVTGSQEDIDLLVIYKVANTLALLFVEAKGSAAFDRVQLARKLIRLDRILVDSGVAKNCENSLPYLLVLASPNKPNFLDVKDRKKELDCLQFAEQLPKPSADDKQDKFKAMREALKDHKSEIGKGLNYLPICGYPKPLYAVKRVGADAAAEEKYTHWTLEKR